MLRLMGIDVWRIRHAPCAGITGPQENPVPADVSIGNDEPERGAGQLYLYSAGATGSPLVLLSEAPGEIADDTAKGKLLDAILLALHSTRDRATLAGDAALGDALAVHDLVRRCSPSVILVLGKVTGFDGAKGVDDISRGGVIAAADLQTLMARPDAKSRLWGAIVSSGAVAFDR